METIGQRIAEARKAQGMTQEKLAAELNVSRAAVSNWEKDRRLPDAEMMIRLSKLLNVDFVNGNARETAEGAPGEPAEGVPEETAKDTPVEKTEAVPEAPSAEAPADKGSPAEEKTPGTAGTVLDMDKIRKAASISRRAKILLAVALVLIAGILLWVFLKPGVPQYKSSEGKTYTIEQLKESVPNQEGKPYLRIDLSKTITGEYLMYAFQCYEVNGRPLDVKRVDLIYFKKDGTTPVEFYSAESLQKAGMDMHIPANGSWVFDGGMLQTESQKAYGVGMILHAMDETGEEMTFTEYLPFEG